MVELIVLAYSVGRCASILVAMLSYKPTRLSRTKAALDTPSGCPTATSATLLLCKSASEGSKVPPPPPPETTPPPTFLNIASSATPVIASAAIIQNRSIISTIRSLIIVPILLSPPPSLGPANDRSTRIIVSRRLMSRSMVGSVGGTERGIREN